MSSQLAGSFSVKETVVGIQKFFISQERWGAQDWAFRIVSKNAQPRPIEGEPPLPQPFGLTAQGPAAYNGGGGFKVTFVDEIVTTNGGAPQPHEATRDILAHPPEDFSVLPCDNHLDLVASEFAQILSPLFFSDDQNTFFVEPSLEEITTEEWDDWAIPVPRPDPRQHTPDWFNAIRLEPAIPLKVLPKAIEPQVIDPLARFTFRPRADWVTNEATAVQLGATFVGAQGAVGGVITTRPSFAASGATSASSTGSGATIAAGVIRATERLAASPVAEALVTVGTSGLNPGQLQRLQKLSG